jgi:hypothetical protein
MRNLLQIPRNSTPRLSTATPDGHVFDSEDETEVIDSNKVNLLKAAIKKRLKKGNIVHYDMNFPDTRRLPIRTP